MIIKQLLPVQKTFIADSDDFAESVMNHMGRNLGDLLFGEVVILKTPCGNVLSEIGEFDPLYQMYNIDGTVTDAEFISIDALPHGESAFQLEE